MIRVYQYGARPPTAGAEDVARQMRAGHAYANDLVQIERGRRAAIRALHESSSAVVDAMAALRAATKTDRRERLRALAVFRRAAERDTRCTGGHWAVPEDLVEWYPYSPLYEYERIALLDSALRRGARALTTAYYGTYLTIEASADQARKAPLYDRNGLTPAEPRFRRWRDEGQVGTQLQGGLPTSRALAGDDTRTRLSVLEPDRARRRYERRAVLQTRVDSIGREPVFARVPLKMHRAIPDAAKWKWVRVSKRREGPFVRWSTEITLDIPGEPARTRDSSLEGAIAVELLWTPLDDGSMRVAVWLDSRGRRGEILLPAYTVSGIRKPDGIRSVRDTLLNHLRPQLARAIRESRDDKPRWLEQAAASLHLWRSPWLFYGLVSRWRAEKCDAAREAYDLLQAWELRDHHLWEYEAGARGEALRERREQYRVLAARWSRQYRAVLVPDRDLSREAKFGEDGDRRFTAATQELRGALRSAFGSDAHDVEWRGPHGVIDEGDEEQDVPSWLEMAIERWRDGEITVSARRRRKDSKSAHVAGGAWASRKGMKRARAAEVAAARDPGRKVAE